MSVGTSERSDVRDQPVPRTLAERTAALMVRRRKPVMLAWLVIILLAAPLAATVHTALSGAGWNAQGSQSEDVRYELREDFPALGAEAAVVVVQAPAGMAPDAAVGELVEALAGQTGVREITDPRSLPEEAAGATVVPAGSGRTRTLPSPQSMLNVKLSGEPSA
jgi:RND superfamily putative drug exporter